MTKLFKKCLVVLMLMALCVAGCGTTDGASDGSQNSNESNITGKSETVANKYIAIAESADPTFSVSENSITFMDAHEEFFPGNENNDGAMSDYLNWETDYPHLSKSIGKYTGELFSVYGYVVDIKELDDGSLTYIHIVDYSEYNYTFYYLGTLDDAFEGSEVMVYALPFDMVTFENLGGTYTEAVVGAACYVEVYDFEYDY